MLFKDVKSKKTAAKLQEVSVIADFMFITRGIIRTKRFLARLFQVE